jgi:miniconductance mechanosensitive channel
MDQVQDQVQEVSSEGINEWLTSFLEMMNVSGSFLEVFEIVIPVFIIGILAFLAFFVTRRLLLFSIIKVVRGSKSKLDDFLVHRKVFHRAAHLAPIIVVYFLSRLFFADFPVALTIVNKIVAFYALVVAVFVLQALLRAIEDIYNTFPFAHERPIKGYLQVIQLLVIIVAVLVAMRIFWEFEIMPIFTGMGAFIAVVMLVFQDSILGLVAGIQLSANKMVRVGDWISMPSHNADGIVLEISLNTVKVSNWDKTISTIPTYAMVSNSFINWRGMEESGGRRMARSVHIDTHSVKFCSPEMLERFKKIHHLKSYIEQRQQEIEQYNRLHDIDESLPVNGRRMTNLGIFRKYLENYLINHPKINEKMTLIVRHLDPTEKGIPIQVYAFSRDQAWAKFEGVQADVFDHILAIVPLFELRIFQNPSGDDLKDVAQRYMN